MNARNNERNERIVNARARFGTAAETLGKSGDSERVALTFDLLPGHREKYDTMTWFGFLTENGLNITLTALRNCGWEGDMINDLRGVDKNEVRLVLVDEEYQGKWRTKVKFVNRLAGFVNKDPLTDGSAMALAQRVRAAAAVHKTSYGAAGTKTHSQQNGSSFDGPPPNDGDFF